MIPTHRLGDEAPHDDAAYRAAQSYLYDRIDYERMVGGGSRYPFRLRRMTELLRRLGLQGYLHADSAVPKVPLVHLAGTKGKGSTAAMVAAGLTASGRRTGLYTSPHLHDLEERFRVDGVPCRKQALVSLVEQVRPVTDRMAADSFGSPSFFELTTAIALLHFDRSECDAIVLEVGLGGRLDSTNVCVPSVTAVTSIGRDHQHVLGNTLEQIAREKAGIIKHAIPVVRGIVDPGSGSVIDEIAAQKQAPLYRLGREFEVRWESDPDWGSRVRFRGHCDPLRGEIDLDLPLEGEHQARNAGLAVAMLRLLDSQGVSVSDAAIRGGMASLVSDGRIERYLLEDGILGIVDAAHNEDSIAALCRCLRLRAADRHVSIVFGTSLDKPAAAMLIQLADVCDDLVLTRFLGNPRSRPVDELAPLVPPSLAARTQSVDDPRLACETARHSAGPGGVLVVCGSFFLAAETRGWFWSRRREGDATGPR